MTCFECFWTSQNRRTMSDTHTQKWYSVLNNKTTLRLAISSCRCKTTDYIKLQHSFPKDCQSVCLPLSSGKGKQKTNNGGICKWACAVGCAIKCHQTAHQETTILTSWWLNQPLWKICSSKWVHLPDFRGEQSKKYLSCHHPVRFKHPSQNGNRGETTGLAVLA